MKKLSQNRALPLFMMLALLADMLVPKIASANTFEGEALTLAEDLTAMEIFLPVFRFDPVDEHLPQNIEIEIAYTADFVLTQYNSVYWQTDSTPCITADGYDLCKPGAGDVVATNILPFGTKVRIPSLFGNRVFVVHDRMNSRYNGQYRLDIHVGNKDEDVQAARQFGAKVATVEVLESEEEII